MIKKHEKGEEKQREKLRQIDWKLNNRLKNIAASIDEITSQTSRRSHLSCPIRDMNKRK